MKRIDMEKPFQVLANLAVIVGIAFLGMEIHQNNELLRFQKSLSSLQVMLSVTTSSNENPDFLLALEQAMAGKELSPTDTLLLRNDFSRAVLTMEWQFKELPDTRERSRKVLSRSMENLPLTRQWWDEQKGDYDSEFVTYIEAQR